MTLQGDNTVIVLDALATAGTSGLGSFVTRFGTGLAPQGGCADPATNRMFVKGYMDLSCAKPRRCLDHHRR